MKKTILLSSSGPGLSGVGGVLISSMLHTAGVQNLSLVSMVSPESEKQIDRSTLKNIRVYHPPNEFCNISPGSIRAFVKKYIHRRRKYDADIRKLTAQIGEYIRSENPGQVWAILNSTAVIDVLYGLLPELPGDLLVQLWDDPLHLARQRKLDRLTRHRTSRRFHAILKRSKRTAVICEEMEAAYAAQCNGNYLIVRHGMGDEPIIPRFEPACPSEFRIGLSGSMYSPSAWKTLQKSLDILQWRIDGRQVVLVVVGGRIEFTSRSSAECRFYGWRPLGETIQLMSQCDLLYLPQAFESSERLLTQLSFPTKLSTYAVTGRPILIHTPEYGSLTRFCRQHDIGLLCHTLSADELAALLRRCEDTMVRSEQAKATCRIGTSVLTESQFHTAVQTFLGLDVHDHNPSKVIS